eukprot:TRINITY_DN8118_c0_g1_i2.p1 TRINITY_DN8118_c0_g1~~TRINITY_DN8118_c0_g1_i2.p1  ORF type:complete len:124 (-),score=34.13 TRINITY_DN8118_c0_g1_i2:202-573(-)
MKLLSMSLAVLCLYWTSATSQGLSPYRTRPSEQELVEYILARQAETGYPQIDISSRPKRGWWGNKHRDNKSWGFWITALNKAGNKKKRDPFIPAMSPQEMQHFPFSGYSDYSNYPELFPDMQD